MFLLLNACLKLLIFLSFHMILSYIQVVLESIEYILLVVEN